jgi:hypothetical protein
LRFEGGRVQREIVLTDSRHKAAVEASKAAADLANRVLITLPAQAAAENPWVTSSEEK